MLEVGGWRMEAGGWRLDVKIPNPIRKSVAIRVLKNKRQAKNRTAAR